MDLNKKNILIFGATSEMAVGLIEILLKKECKIFAVSRSDLKLSSDNLFKYKCDLANEDDINKLFSNFENTVFDYVINFQGVAISSPVEFLSSKMLDLQLKISLFSVSSILRNLRDKINKNGMVVYVSSMASFGIYPFLAPYTISKSSVDTLLACYEMETGIKTVSVKPGVVGTKFWQFSVNENNFESFPYEYKEIGEFLKTNALKNSTRGLKAQDVSKLIYKILSKKHPKSSYTIGIDAYFTKLFSNLKGRILYKVINIILKKRVKNAK